MNKRIKLSQNMNKNLLLLLIEKKNVSAYSSNLKNSAREQMNYTASLAYLIVIKNKRINSSGFSRLQSLNVKQIN